MAFHQAAACVLALMLMAPLSVLILARIYYAQGREKVFPDGQWLVWQQGRLYFEDFYNKTNVRSQPIVQQLDFSISVADMKQNETLDSFYRQCARNLKKAAPKLKFMAINGGYIFNPENGTIEELNEELGKLPLFFDKIVQIYQEFGWTITNFNFNGVMVFDSRVIKTAHFPQTVGAAFNKTISGQVEDTHKTEMDAKFALEVNEIKIQVFLSANAAELFRQSPQGRSKFYMPLMRIGIPPRGRN